MFIIKHVVPLYQCTFGIYIRNRPASVLYYNTQGFQRAIFTWELASIHLLNLLQRTGCKIIPICIYSMEYVLMESFVLHYVSTNHSEHIQRTFFSWKKKKSPENAQQVLVFFLYVCVCICGLCSLKTFAVLKNHHVLIVENLEKNEKNIKWRKKIT